MSAEKDPHFDTFRKVGNHFECNCHNRPIPASDILVVLFNRLEELEEYVFRNLPEVPPADSGRPMAPS